MANTKYYIASLVILLSFLSISNLHAQDIHYTQFTLQGMQQSPAFAGNFDGNHRFATLYRNQWATVSVPYNTLGFSYDVNILESKSFKVILLRVDRVFLIRLGMAGYAHFIYSCL